MDTAARRPARPAAARARRGAAVGLAVGTVLTSLVPVQAAYAGLSVPEGWSNPDPVSPGAFVLLLVALPLGLALLIALAVYLPALIRGEKVSPGPSTTEDQWFGGPRQGTRELAGPDDENSQAGGAGARW